MIRRLNESRKDEVLKMTDIYRKYITRCKNLLDHIERDWDDFAAYLETTNGTNQYYDDIDSNIYELSKAFTGLNYLQVAIRNVLGKPVEKVLENKNCKRGKYMIRPINEGFENESFVAYYKGNLFYTGDLDDDFQQSILELIKDDKEALKSVSDYLYYVGIEDFDVNDPEEVAYLLEKDMYYDAIDGQDYWGFDDFEIFPEYELDESIRRRLKSTRTTRRVK